MLCTEGNGHRHPPSVQHSCGAPEGARSRKPRPVRCLGNRALNGRPTGHAEVGVARCPVTERLVSTGTGSLDLPKIVSPITVSS